MDGAEALLESLKREGVDVLFGISGGAILPIYDALGKQEDIWSILTRHEQGAGHMAEGYARATGRVGVCMGTSGPGATNLVTAITDAFMDSTPIVVITGQVATPNIGKDAFQECDTFGITMPVVKHNYLVRRSSDIPRIVKEAFYLARTGRPGPVLIDIPKDISAGPLDQFLYPETVNLRGYNPNLPAATEQIKAAAKLIAEARQPVLYVGNGINAAGAADELLKLAEKIDAPVTTTLLGRGGFPAGHQLSLDMLGMHGTAYANWAVHEADLLIALGARFDDRVTGDPKAFAPNAKVIHVDIDSAELGKIRFAQVPILGDVKSVINQLTEVVAPKKHTQWLERIDEWKKAAPLTYENTGTGKLKPQQVIAELNKATDGEAIVTTDVGQHQMWAAQYYNPKRTRSFITSGGLGTMGYGYPAAIGAKVGCIDREVWCITGDGSFQMNLQELATGVLYDIPVKIALLNNSSLGMVRQWQKMFYERRWSGIDLSRCPDFAKLAEAYSATGVTITEADEVADAIREAQKNPGTVLLNFMTDAEEDVFPMIPGGKTVHDMVLDSSNKAVPIPGSNGNGLDGATATATASTYTSEWTDDINAGKKKI
ncbi:MAG: biosynthetic-type acetolactate synthase large subunit [Abitibacteriaceae bacterium]|nr:biosynthetic-type acetolactate synthase large subunit [Abditibacteriaceae bacterium]